DLLLVVLDLLADDVADFRSADLHERISPRKLSARAGHAPGEPCELRLDAAVVHRAAGIEHHATYQVRIDLGGNDHLFAAGQPAGETLELRTLIVRQRRRAPDVHPRPAELAIDER